MVQGWKYLPSLSLQCRPSSNAQSSLMSFSDSRVLERRKVALKTHNLIGWILGLEFLVNAGFLPSTRNAHDSRFWHFLFTNKKAANCMDCRLYRIVNGWGQEKIWGIFYFLLLRYIRTLWKARSRLVTREIHSTFIQFLFRHFALKINKKYVRSKCVKTCRHLPVLLSILQSCSSFPVDTD